MRDEPARLDPFADVPQWHQEWLRRDRDAALLALKIMAPFGLVLAVSIVALAIWGPL